MKMPLPPVSFVSRLDSFIYLLWRYARTWAGPRTELSL